MKKYLLLALCACGGPVSPELMDVPEPPIYPYPLYEAGLPYDAGTPDAGAYPWADCAHHKKSQGHGKGLEKNCDL